MAGIGFRLQKLLTEEMYLSVAQSFFYALVLTSGPWLIMVISLELLSLFSTFLVSMAYRQLFKILLVHIYFLTIVVTGTFQLFFTRIFADKLYNKERDALPDVIMTHLLLSLGVLTALFLPFVIVIDLPIPVKLLAFSLFWAMDVLWVLLTYVSASDDFLQFMKHFLFGSLLSFGLGSSLGYFFDFLGLLAGFVIGQAYTALVLFVKIVQVFGFPKHLDVALIRTFWSYRALLASGFFLYAGMWVDKLIFWYSPSGRRFYSLLYYHPAYNDIFYIAFLFTTPIMAIFFLTMETSFYKAYYGYNQTVMKKGQAGALDALQACQTNIRQSIRRSLSQIIRIQGLILLVGILFSRRILALLNMPAELDRLLNIILPGVFFHMLILILCVLLLYFDLKEETLSIYGAFFLLNTGLTLVFLKAGEAYSGLGYTIAAILVCGYAWRRLRYHVNDLNFLMFTRRELREDRQIATELFIPATGGYGRYYLKNGEKLIDTV